MDIVALLGSWFSHEQAIEVVCSLNGGDQRITDEDMIAQKDSSDRLWVPPPKWFLVKYYSYHSRGLS